MCKTDIKFFRLSSSITRSGILNAKSDEKALVISHNDGDDVNISQGAVLGVFRQKGKNRKLPHH